MKTTTHTAKTIWAARTLTAFCAVLGQDARAAHAESLQVMSLPVVTEEARDEARRRRAAALEIALLGLEY